MTEKFDAIIIGGGHNGLVCAFYLARKGLKTCVLERAEKVGGAAITETFYQQDGESFRNSVASYTVSLLQTKVIEDMRLHDHGLRIVLRPVDNFLPTDSGYLLAGRDGLTRKEIARISPSDLDGYDRYAEDLHRVVAAIRPLLLQAPPNAGGGLSDVLRLIKQGRGISKLSVQTQSLLLDFFTVSAAEILDRYFEHDLIKALFGFDAVVGHFASPYAPGTAYVLLHHVFGQTNGVEGAWGHAIGGMGAITQAMKSACLEQGVDIRTGQTVEALTIENGRVSGAKTEEGLIEAKLVAASVHPKILYEDLIQPDQMPKFQAQVIQNYQSQSATFRMNVALDRLPAFRYAPTEGPKSSSYLSSGIIIAPSLDYMDRAWASAKQDGWSAAPIIEMLIPSTLDETMAPPGKHVASLFCQHFRYDLGRDAEGHPRSWQDAREGAADHIINTVDHYAPGFAQSVLGRQVLSPLDLENRFALIGGDIFHGRMSLDQMFSARPALGMGAYKSPIKGLYMCGSGTHPGGGVTGAPGHNAAHRILRDLRFKSV